MINNDSVIQYMKAALVFYADEKSYHTDQKTVPIINDGGEMARHALKQVADFDEINKLENNLVDLIKSESNVDDKVNELFKKYL